MTLQRVPVKWLTDDDRVAISRKLSDAHDAVESAVWQLRNAAPTDTPSSWPDPAPTLETIGGVFDLQHDVRSHIDSMTNVAKELEEALQTLNLVRLNYEIRIREDSRA